MGKPWDATLSRHRRISSTTALPRTAPRPPTISAKPCTGDAFSGSTSASTCCTDWKADQSVPPRRSSRAYAQPTSATRSMDSGFDTGASAKKEAPHGAGQLHRDILNEQGRVSDRQCLSLPPLAVTHITPPNFAGAECRPRPRDTGVGTVRRDSRLRQVEQQPERPSDVHRRRLDGLKLATGLAWSDREFFGAEP